VRRYHKKPRWITAAYNDYTKKRQTFADLSERYEKDPKTIRKAFDEYYPVTGEIIPEDEPVNIVMDATFFKRGDGYMVARANSRNLHWFPIETEKVEHYEQCLNTLEAAEFTFKSFTIDGRRGVRKLLQKRYPHVPIQHCQYHQLQTIIQKLTQRPKLQASKDLRAIALTISRTTRKKFTSDLNTWYMQWGEFIKERTESSDLKRKWRWKHEKLRSAYFSLRRNLPWLFTHLDYPNLHIPNTTNSCDGSFSHWKNKVILHRGMKQHRKKKMIDFLLEDI
jgi:hypothetical protein